jgi:hypothetical protein
MDIDHLDGGELFERASRGQAGSQGVQAAAQSDVQAVGEKGDEDVGFDPLLVLVEDRSDGEVALEVLESLFDGDELDIVLPEQGGIVVGEIGAQQIASLAAAYGSQLLAIEGPATPRKPAASPRA